MLKRLVKMTFRPDVAPDFLKIFKESKNAIRDFPGCRHLELWRDKRHPNVFFTYSMWDAEDDLNAYRQSELFQTTWARTKALFDAKPEAWSVDGLEYLP